MSTDPGYEASEPAYHRVENRDEVIKQHPDIRVVMFQVGQDLHPVLNFPSVCNLMAVQTNIDDILDVLLNDPLKALHGVRATGL